jgi:hypothetical protein
MQSVMRLTLEFPVGSDEAHGFIRPQAVGQVGKNTEVVGEGDRRRRWLTERWLAGEIKQRLLFTGAQACHGGSGGRLVHRRGGQATALGGGWVGPTKWGFSGITSGKMGSKPSGGRMRAAFDCSRKNEQRMCGFPKDNGLRGLAYRLRSRRLPRSMPGFSIRRWMISAATRMTGMPTTMRTASARCPGMVGRTLRMTVIIRMMSGQWTR